MEREHGVPHVPRSDTDTKNEGTVGYSVVESDEIVRRGACRDCVIVGPSQ